MDVYSVSKFSHSLTSLFAVDFSVSPDRYDTLPPNMSVYFDSNGATIHKMDSRVGFYLPLKKEINASNSNYLTLQIKYDVEDLELEIVCYYDVNRDGKWSGYEIDYVKSLTFNQNNLGWTADEWHNIYLVIPQADDPIVQIGIILMGNKNGTITLRNLAVYTEITSENSIN